MATYVPGPHCFYENWGTGETWGTQRSSGPEATGRSYEATCNKTQLRENPGFSFLEESVTITKN